MKKYLPFLASAMTLLSTALAYGSAYLQLLNSWAAGTMTFHAFAAGLTSLLLWVLVFATAGE